MLQAQHAAEVKAETEARQALADEAAAKADLVEKSRKADAARAVLAASTQGVDATPLQSVTTTTTASDGTTVEKKVDIWSQDALQKLDAPKATFGGIEFGVGIAFTYDLGNDDRIKEASLVGDPGVLRVTRSENVRARIVLESHYMFLPKGDFLGVETGKWGIGPFVALQPGTDNVIEALGAGLMLALKRPSTEEDSDDSFNIGVGVMYDMNAQVLGAGMRENEPLPAGETEVRFRTESQSGLLVMTSYSF